MKKTLIGALVLAALLLLAPLGLGRLAERQANALLDNMVEQVPYLSIAERSWERGWFTSRQTVTVVSALPAGGETRPRYTLHNDVLHGPLLGLSGIGAARVRSRIDLPARLQASIRETFGPDPALEMTTRVGFFGGGSTVLRSRGRALAPFEDGAQLTYETMRWELDFSRSLDSYEMEARLPRAEIRDADGVVTVLDRFTLDGEAERLAGYAYLYDTDFQLRLRSLEATDPAGTFRVEDLHYEGEMAKRDELYSMSMKVGAGAVRGPQVEASGVQISQVNYDVSLRRLHAQTLDSLYGSMQSFYRTLPTEPDADAEALGEAMGESFFAPLRQHAGQLLAHDPELALDRVGIVTPEGEAVLKGVIRVVGMTVQDFEAAGLLALVDKLDAELHFEIEQALAEKIPSMAMMMGPALDSGYLRPEGDKLVANIQFRNGALLVNGQTQSLPLPGAAPPPQLTPVP